MKLHEKNSLKETILGLIAEYGDDAIEFIIGIIKNRKNKSESDEFPCDKNNPTDPHYGEYGDYDEKCQWHPGVDL